MEELIATLTIYAEQYGIFFLVPLLFVENVPILGLIAPGVTVLVLSGFFSEVLPGGPIAIFSIIFLTMMLSDTLWYTLGYRVSPNLWFFQYIKQRSPHIEQTVTTQSVYFLMFYQFVPYLRMFLPFALGMYKLEPKKWLKITVFGSFLYTCVYFGLGWAAGLWYQTIDDSESILALGPLLTSIITILFSIRLVSKYLEKRRLITEPEP